MRFPSNPFRHVVAWRGWNWGRQLVRTLLGVVLSLVWTVLTALWASLVWLGTGLSGNFRAGLISAVVGGASGGFAAVIFEWATAPEVITSVVDVGVEGEGFPNFIFSAANGEAMRREWDEVFSDPTVFFDDPLTFELDFNPAELRDVRVCESAILRDTSHWSMALTYIAKYPDCFHLIQNSNEGDSYSVYPNEQSGSLSKSVGSNGNTVFRCRCAEVSK